MIVITTGEPAGIGPDLLIQFSQTTQAENWVALACPDLLMARARLLNLPIQLHEWQPNKNYFAKPGDIYFIAVKTKTTVVPGLLNEQQVPYVLTQLKLATELCLQQPWALLTLPIHKGIINQAGIDFSGHTEWLAAMTHTQQVVMMLAAGQHRVALVTTHLALRQVPDKITAVLLESVISLLYQQLQRQFSIADPIIHVCGLNPHAGEQGYLGHEEMEIIEPVLKKFQQRHQKVMGPFSADTLFQFNEKKCDAYLAMYHDQGLTPLKTVFEGHIANITLGLPFIRTSVDHGTALTLAGTGSGSISSLQAAFQQTTLLMKKPYATLCS